MAELALAAGVSGSIAAGAAATTAAAGSAAVAAGATFAGLTAAQATAAAASVAASASTLAMLQGVANAVSAVGAIGGGVMAMKSASDKATETQLQIGQEQVAAQNRHLQLRRELVSILGENDVTFAAAGIDISSGLAVSTRREAEQVGASDLSLERADDDMRAALLRARVRGYRRSGAAAVGGGLLKAAGIGLNTGIDVMERG